MHTIVDEAVGGSELPRREQVSLGEDWVVLERGVLSKARREKIATSGSVRKAG